MPRVNPPNFASAETLRQVRPDLLRAWLEPARDFLARYRIVLPEAGSAEPAMPDIDALASLFAEPAAGLPPGLVNSLFLIQGMANPAGMDTILESAEMNGLDLGLGEDPAPADVAVKAWLLNPALLENLHHCQEMTRPRAFRYFSTDADPVPRFDGPTAEKLSAIEQRLEPFYLAWKRGPGARLFAYRQEHEWWFLLRHGAPCRREPALERGRPTSVFFRPLVHDVLVYDPLRGELRVNCCTVRERKALLRAFGSCLFGRATFFPGTAKYTLAPLLRRGRDCLACADVPGIERVSLTEVEFYFREKPWHRVTRRADDIFALVESRNLRWPARADEITRATFEVKLWRTRRPRRVTIVPCNKALYGRDEDSTVLEQWLEAREFIVEETHLTSL